MSRNPHYVGYVEHGARNKPTKPTSAVRMDVTDKKALDVTIVEIRAGIYPAQHSY